MKTISLSFLLLALLLHGQLMAGTTGQMVGQITDQETAKPVAHARVVFENSMDKIELTTNAHGFYYGDHIPSGRYTMTIYYNDRTFILKRIHVYDSYASELNVAVSSSAGLPEQVLLQATPSLISSVTPTDILVKNPDGDQSTHTLSDVLSLQPGVDVRDGQLFIKGSSDVRFFIDGTPVMGQAVLGRGW